MGDVRALLARTTLVVRSGPFVMAGWPRDSRTELLARLPQALPPGDDPWALVDDDLELTLFLREDALPRLPAPTQSEPGWSVLTLDEVMPWDVVGVLAELTQELADVGVSVGAFTAYSRDHVLVHAAQLDGALEVLSPLFAQVDQRG